MEQTLLFLFIFIPYIPVTLPIDPRLVGVDRDNCDDYPGISPQLSTYSPIIGFVIYYDDLMFVLEKPKTTLHYPRVVKVNPVRYTDASYYPFNAIVRVGEFMRVEPKYYALKFNRNDPKKILRYYEMSYLSALTKEIKERDLKNSFLNIDNLPKVRAVISALIIPTSGNDYYSGVIYNISVENQNITEVKFKVNGNVQVAKNSIETIDTVTNDNRMVTLDMFDFVENQTAIGYRSYGTSFRYFMGDDSMPSIVGKSAWMDNQVLIGCPLTYCIGGELDAGTVGPDGKLYLFFNSYYYALPSDKRVFPASKLAKQIHNIPVVGLGPGIRFPIHAAYSDGKKMYLFASDDRLWVSKHGFTDFSEYRASIEYNELPRNFWQNSIDAIFTNDNLKMLFIMKDINYYVLHLEHLHTDNRYLNSFPLGERSYPRPIRDFEIVPENVDAAITMPNGETFITYAEFVFIVKKWNTETGRASAPPEVGLLQDVLFDCKAYNYRKSEYRTSESHANFVRQETPEAANATKTITITNVATYSTMVFGALLLLIIVIIGAAKLYQIKSQNDRTEEYKKKHKSRRRKFPEIVIAVNISNADGTKKSKIIKKTKMAKIKNIPKKISKKPNK